jgi:WD40 repeat protein
LPDARASIPSVVARTRALDVGGPVVGAHFLADAAVLVLGEDALLLVPRQGDVRRIAAHDGAILSSAADRKRVITGGDDGKVVATAADGASAVIAIDSRHRWIDHVAIGTDDAVAWSAGNHAFARAGGGAERVLEVASTVGGLAFLPKGYRLAIAHYNGATLWFPNARAAPDKLAWKGSHLAVIVSPDGRFVITAMQEPTLHGWRLADHKDMRMSGYGARVRSLDWTAGGKWLATSGATQLIVWPFQARDGPMGKTPQILAPSEAQVEVVSCHPKQELVAVGYADGLVLLVRLEDGAEVLARAPDNSAVAALAWNAGGNLLAFGTETGQAGVIDLG